MRYTLMTARPGQPPIRVFSMTTAYIRLHPDGDHSGSFLKYGGSLMLDTWSQPIMGCTLMAARAGQPLIQVFTLMVTLREAS